MATDSARSCVEYGIGLSLREVAWRVISSSSIFSRSSSLARLMDLFRFALFAGGGLPYIENINSSSTVLGLFFRLNNSNMCY